MLEFFIESIWSGDRQLFISTKIRDVLNRINETFFYMMILAQHILRFK